MRFFERMVIHMGIFSGLFQSRDKPTDSTVQRQNELYATNGQIGYVATERVDGKVILPEGIQLLQMKGTASSGS